MRSWCHGGAGKSKNNGTSIGENIHTKRTLEMKSKRIPFSHDGILYIQEM